LARPCIIKKGKEKEGKKKRGEFAVVDHTALLLPYLLLNLRFCCAGAKEEEKGKEKKKTLF